jgi:hypothetical protein
MDEKRVADMAASNRVEYIVLAWGGERRQVEIFHYAADICHVSGTM